MTDPSVPTRASARQFKSKFIGELSEHQVANSSGHQHHPTHRCAGSNSHPRRRCAECGGHPAASPQGERLAALEDLKRRAKFCRPVPEFQE